MKRLAAILFLIGVSASAQTAVPISGFCTVGGKKVTISGLTSVGTVQASYPRCTVTVFVHGGGGTKETIYADSLLTPLTNPFTANLDGSFTFYINNSDLMDVTLSGGDDGGFASPFTYVAQSNLGDAVTIQGIPVDVTAPTANQYLRYDGAKWAPTSTVNATQIQGFGISVPATAGTQPVVNPGATAITWQTKPSIDVRDKGVVGSGDEITALQSAVTAVSTAGGGISFPQNLSASISSTLNMALAVSTNYAIAMRGQGTGGVTSVVRSPSELSCNLTGAGRCIDARSTQGDLFQGMGFYSPNATFTGYLIDAAHNATVADTNLLKVINNAFYGPSVANSNFTALNLDLAIGALISGNYFPHGSVGVYMNQSGYSNANNLVFNQFFHQKRAPFVNPGQMTLMLGNLAEGCYRAAGSAIPCFVKHDNGVTTGPGPVAMIGNWMGDIGVPGNWFDGSINGGGNVLSAGNYIQGTAIVYNISAISCAANTVTLTTATANEAVVGSAIKVGVPTPVTDATYDGNFVIAGISDSTHFTYYATTCPGGASSGGTVKVFSDAYFVNGVNGATGPIASVGNTQDDGVGLVFGPSTSAGGANNFNSFMASNGGAAATIDFFDPYGVASGFTGFGLRNPVCTQSLTTQCATNVISTSGGLAIGGRATAGANIPVSIFVETAIANGPLNLGAATGAATAITAGNSNGSKIALAPNTRGIGIPTTGNVVAYVDGTFRSFCVGVADTTAGHDPLIGGGYGGDAVCLRASGAVATNSASNTDLAGSLTLVTGTKSYNFSVTYTTAPICVASDTAATPVAVQVTTSTTALTLTVPGGANTDTFNYICVART